MTRCDNHPGNDAGSSCHFGQVLPCYSHFIYNCPNPDSPLSIPASQQSLIQKMLLAVTEEPVFSSHLLEHSVTGMRIWLLWSSHTRLLWLRCGAGDSTDRLGAGRPISQSKISLMKVRMALTKHYRTLEGDVGLIEQLSPAGQQSISCNGETRGKELQESQTLHRWPLKPLVRGPDRQQHSQQDCAVIVGPASVISWGLNQLTVLESFHWTRRVGMCMGVYTYAHACILNLCDLCVCLCVSVSLCESCVCVWVLNMCGFVYMCICECTC